MSYINTKPDLALETIDLRKTYPGRRKTPPMEALKGVSLQIPRGSIFGLLGPNGAGKSTLINIFAGLTRKTSGIARIWDFDIDEAPRQARAAIGVVPQEINMDPFFFRRWKAWNFRPGFTGYPSANGAAGKSWRPWAWPTKPMPMYANCPAA
ncbi:MAG: ATP-binding cassette domain-containing protein [Robiginitomaculum sp.]|nr:ATP-binding cassette domain-containing protein [Robiginitomaculum sp.]